MPGPSTKPKAEAIEPVFVPHPDDEAEVCAAFDAVERGELLSAEESAEYLRALLGEGDPSDK
jgi:hypothetical protein